MVHNEDDVDNDTQMIYSKHGSYIDAVNRRPLKVRDDNACQWAFFTVTLVFLKWLKTYAFFLLSKVFLMISDFL